MCLLTVLERDKAEVKPLVLKKNKRQVSRHFNIYLLTRATLNCKGQHDLFKMSKSMRSLYSISYSNLQKTDTHCAMILGYHSSAISWTLPKQYCFPSDSVVRSMFLNPNSVH